MPDRDIVTGRWSRTAPVLATDATMRAEAVAAAAQPGNVTMDATTMSNDAKAVFDDASDRAREGVAKTQALFGEMGDFGKGNVEALVESSKIAARGFEALGKDAAAYVRASFEDAQAQARTLAAATSPTEFFRLQGDYAQRSFDKMVAETSRGTEAMLKLVGEVAQPLSNRAALAADRMKAAA